MLGLGARPGDLDEVQAGQDDGPGRVLRSRDRRSRLLSAETTLQTEFPKVQIKAFPSQTAEITALKAGQIDGVFLGGADAAAVAPTSKDFYRGATVQIPTPDATAVRKGHTALLDAINSQLHTLIKDGTFMKLWNQYVPFAPASQALKAYPAMRKGLAKRYRKSMT